MIKPPLLRHWFASIAIGAIALEFGFLAQPGLSAEKLTARYGPFYRSFSVSDLQQYADTGKASPQLNSFLSLVNQKKKDSLRTILNLKLPLGVVAVDGILKSSRADQLLTKLSDATILPGHLEKEALRGAIITAAASKEGLGTMSILNHYPTPTLTVDLKKMLTLLKENKDIIPGLGGMGGTTERPSGSSTLESTPMMPQNSK
jgi:Alpha/beta hydrolase of unknown function (DUF1400)